MTTFTLTPTEEAKLSEQYTWLGTNGNGAAIAGESGWSEAFDDDDRVTFMRAWGPWSSFKDWLDSITDEARRRWLEYKMVGMILDYIAEVLG